MSAYGLWWVLDQLLGQSLIAQLVSLGVGLGVGTACFIAAGRMLRLSDVDILHGLVARR